MIRLWPGSPGHGKGFWILREEVAREPHVFSGNRQCELRIPVDECAESDLKLYPCQGCPDTERGARTEGQVPVGRFACHEKLLWFLELGLVPVPGTHGNEHRGSCRYEHPGELDIGDRVPGRTQSRAHESPPQRLFDRGGQEVRICSQGIELLRVIEQCEETVTELDGRTFVTRHQHDQR